MVGNIGRAAAKTVAGSVARRSGKLLDPNEIGGGPSLIEAVKAGHEFEQRGRQQNESQTRSP